jgi:hypothetical protein
MKKIYSPAPLSSNRAVISIVFSILFLFLFSCTTVSNTTAFNAYAFKPVPPADNRQYIVMKDSSIVYGTKVSGWAIGAIGKRVAHIDGRQIPVSEVLGFQNKEGYWAKLENDAVAKRLINGRISVYRSQYDPQRPSLVFFQKENGPLRGLNSREELKQLIRDCQKAYDMLNISDEEYGRIAKKQSYYLNTVIETYNNCGEWK